jgi:hypothetical protein
MAFSALLIASSRVLPYPDIRVSEMFAAHFQWWRTMPCTTEYSIPRYSIAIAFVCRRDMAANGGGLTLACPPLPFQFRQRVV